LINIIGAIAISQRDEEQIDRLRKELRISTKSGVIRAALQTLEQRTVAARLRREVEQSVHRCATADRREHQELTAAAVARRTSGV
jgi:Arc/MetJ-type ribon-helix-helix transcriptional regulator